MIEILLVSNLYFPSSHSGINIFYQKLLVLIAEATIQRRSMEISEHHLETETEKTHL